jgi:cell division protein FtsQ
MRRILPPPRRALPVLAAVGVLLALLGFWVRDSSFFAVEKVMVVGASGPDAPQVDTTLRRAARGMTTLNIDEGALRQSIERYPTVKDIAVERDLPNGLRITVLERRPIAVVSIAGRRVPLTADGRLLKGATASEDLPALAVKGGVADRVNDEGGRRLLELVAAAPSPLRRKARRAYLGRQGLTLSMNEGPSLYFGSGEDLQAKWSAAARVLADPSSEGARYVDVRAPDRPAAGGVGPTVPTPTEPSS